MDYSTPGFLVHHQLLELAETHVRWVGDAIQPSHSLSFPSPPTFNLSQSLFIWVGSSHQVAKVLEFQLQHQFFLSCISCSNSQSSPDFEAVSVSDVGRNTSCKPYSNQHSQLLFWGHRARDFRSIPWGLNGASPRADIYDYKLSCASAELQNLTIRGTCMFFIWCACVIYACMHAESLQSHLTLWPCGL